MKFLHIHGQRRPGNPSNIVGTREGLLALRDAIDRALGAEQKGDSIAHVEAADVEFKVFVKLRPAGEKGNSYWDLAALPYSHPVDRDRRAEAKWPWDETWTQTPRKDAPLRRGDRPARTQEQIEGCNAFLRRKGK